MSTTGHDGDTPRRRQVVKFTFYRVDPAWRRLPPAQREESKSDLCRAVEAFGDRLLIRSYSLMGMRGDADFLLWQAGERLEDIQELATAVFAGAMGPYLSVPHSYLAMTRRSIYAAPKDQDAPASRGTILTPGDSRYLFVYPFVKTRAWYKLPKEERQRMMDEHIGIGRRYPSVKLNTTYSYGLDDQEFVVAFETDEPSDFLDLVMELRETDASAYTLRDTPIFTCVAVSLRVALDSLGAPGDTAPANPRYDAALADGWARVATTDDLPEGASRVVYSGGDQVALFNVGGRIYAVSNRCSHANGPLADGEVEGTLVTCPWHGSRFDLASGRPQGGPAAKPVPTYRVKVEGGAVFVATSESVEATSG
ncbi:MAG: chlorite dismutase family protein [Dehalococcoidia bacterium]